jgi:hypothetical protein
MRENRFPLNISYTEKKARMYVNYICTVLLYMYLGGFRECLTELNETTKKKMYIYSFSAGFW